VSLATHQADGRKWDGTAGLEQAEGADFQEAVRQDLVEEPPDKLPDVKASRS
jgi:hypothetical protein